MVVGGMVSITIGGVEIAVDFTAPAIAALLLLTTPIRDYAILLLACMIHESAHFLFLGIFRKMPARLRISGVGLHLDVPEAVLCPLPVLTAILLAGAAANFTAALLFFAMHIPDAAMVNLSLGVWNLLPYRAADGGTLLYAWLEERMLERNTERLLWIWRAVWMTATALLAAVFLISGGANPSVWGMLIFLVLSELLQ